MSPEMRRLFEQAMRAAGSGEPLPKPVEPPRLEGVWTVVGVAAFVLAGLALWWLTRR